MNTPWLKNRKVHLIAGAIMLTIIAGCCKDGQLYLSDLYMDCSINDEPYHERYRFSPFNQTPEIIAYRDNFFSFHSHCWPIDTTKHLPSYYISYELFLDTFLVEGKKYHLTPLPDLEYLVDMDEYYRQKKSFCSIKLEGGSAQKCFGKGYVEISKIDLDNNKVEGNIDFKIVSPVEADNKKPLKIKGEFNSRLTHDQ